MKAIKGFTLIELVVTMAIVAILAAIAYPSYVDSVRRARRVDAQTAILELSTWMESFFSSEAFRYDVDKSGNAVWNSVPASLKYAPKQGSTKYYNLTLDNLTATTYTIIATPQAAGGQANDECGDLTLTQAGEKGIDNADPGVTAEDCW